MTDQVAPETGAGPMTIDEFWRLIEAAGRQARAAGSGAYTDRYAAEMERLLRERTPDELTAFSNHFTDRMRESYRWDLWGAADILGKMSCSDDWFEYFRCWLISLGREAYERALVDPDSLVEPASDPYAGGYCFFEELPYIPYTLYEEMTGVEMPDHPDPSYPHPPPGTKLRDDRSDLPERYPRLWARFGPRTR